MSAFAGFAGSFSDCPFVYRRRYLIVNSSIESILVVVSDHGVNCMFFLTESQLAAITGKRGDHRQTGQSI